MRASLLLVVVSVLQLSWGLGFNVNVNNGGQQSCRWVGFWFGRRRVCKTVNNNNNNPSADYCSCSGSGDPHYKTFDGATIHFMGICKYTLAKLLDMTNKCYFNVEIKNERRGFNRKVSYTRLVDIKVKGYVIRLHQRNRIFVNGIEKYAPLTLANGLKVTRAGNSMLVTTDCGVMVTFDGRSIVTVKVPKTIGASKMNGLCGSCDGDMNNDYFTSTGQNVMGNPDRYNLIGNSYNVPDDSDQPHTHCMKIPPFPVCSNEQMTLFGNAFQYCGLLADKNKAFGACINSGRVNHAGYLTSCKMDLCANYQTEDETKTICQSLEAMAQDCSTNGMLVNWRLPTFCPMVCADNEVYKHDASGCEATCVNPTVDKCSLTPNEACVCKTGFFRSGNDCVPKSKCGCVDVNGEYYPMGAEKRTENCGEMFKCVFEGGRSFLKKMQNGVTCHADATCRVVSGEHRCACKQGLTGDGVNTCIDLSDRCTCTGQGDPHYMLYDGQRIDFMGMCMYTLSQLTNRRHECWFSVEVKNERRGWNWNVAWTRMIDFAIYGQKIRILSGRRVQVNGRTTYLPVTLAGGKMRVFYNGMKVQVDTDCGISVGFDGGNNVIVSVPSSLGELLNGICGNCNGHQDDYKTKEGADVTRDRNRYNLIGMSYAVTDDSDAVTKGCTPPMEPPRECDEAFVTRISGNDMCGMITDTSGPFKECIDARVVDPEQYFEGCKADICEYSGKKGYEETDLLCDALTAFAAICNNNGFELFWRTAAVCPLECGANEMYNPSVPACQKTCRGTMSGDVCQKPRAEGCACKPGYVLSDSKCVPESECGCEDKNNNYYPIGAEFRSNDCMSMNKCEMTGNGPMLRQYDLGRKCHKDAVCGWKNGDRACVCKDGYAGDGVYSCMNTKPCRCSVVGDPHYVTYDGQVVHFQGTCKYTLTQSTRPDDKCAFNVEVKNENRYYNFGFSWTRMVDFEIYGIRVRLLPKNKVEIDGEEKFLPFTLSNGKLRVSLVAGKVQVDTDCGINVMFDGVQDVIVDVPNSYANQMTGLCGNCNGAEDDYQTKNGTDVSGFQKNEMGKAIGDSYLVDDDSDIPSDKCSQVEVPAGCDATTYKKYSDSDHCGYITDAAGPFKECIESGLVAIEELFESCREDLCGYAIDGMVNPRDIVCESLTSVAASCNTAGFVVTWRKDGFCPMKCPAGFEYDVKVMACPPTCGEPAPKEFCDKPPREGCRCPEGFVLNDKKCAKIQECGCTDEEGNYLPIGEERVSDDCTTLFECKWDTKNVRSFLDTKMISLPCHERAECVVMEGEKKCMCDMGYRGDGITCDKITTPAPETTRAPTTTPAPNTTLATDAPTTTTTMGPTTTTTMGPTTPVPCEIVADIGVIMDSSSSIGPRSYEMMKDFVKNVILGFDVTPDKVRVAVETFNAKPKIQFTFDTHGEKDDIPFAINKIHEINKGTYTHKALRVARTKMFTTARKGVPKIAIVLTDGNSRAPTKTLNEAALLRQSGVTVFCIGIGRVSPKEVNGIASDPDSEHAFLVKDFRALDSIKETITRAACEASLE